MTLARTLAFVLIAALAAPVWSQNVSRRELSPETSLRMPEVSAIAAEEDGKITLLVLGEADGEVQMGDEILMANGKRIRAIADLRVVYEEVAEGDEVKLAVQRGDERFMTAFTKGDGSDAAMTGGGHMRVVMAGPGADSSVFFHEARALVAEEDGAVKVAQILMDTGIGVAAGDVVVALNGEDVETIDDYRRLYEAAAVGDALVFKLRRGDADVEVTIEKAEMPAGMMVRRQGP